MTIEQEWLEALVGATVYVRLVDGEGYRGRLLRYDDPCIELDMDVPTLVYRDALAAIRDVGRNLRARAQTRA